MNQTTEKLDPTNDAHWDRFLHEFRVRHDTTYLNHGSFGIALNCVRYQRDKFQRKLETQPMDFYLRKHESLLVSARQRLAEFVGTQAHNLAFVDNATYAMNVVASSVDLAPGDEVLLTDLEYGAVKRIWEEKAAQTGAILKFATLPEKITDRQQVVDAIIDSVTPQTKLAIVSHIVSATAVILPVSEICAALSERGVLSCVDGPHALLQLDVQLNTIGCDYYTASCHKWLCGPLGTGFVFVNPKHSKSAKQPITGWGRLLPNQAQNWHEEFIWLGTRNISGFLAIPAAINFFEKTGVASVRARLNYLASIAESRLLEELETETIAPRDDGWYGSMAHVALPQKNGIDWSKLQETLWDQDQIEVPIWETNGRWWIRVSTHLYNTPTQIEYLVNCIQRELRQQTRSD